MGILFVLLAQTPLVALKDGLVEAMCGGLFNTIALSTFSPMLIAYNLSAQC
jgi:hypothetical protein